jgi:phosphopantothenoylcysteine decarboxylase/phosphopantothenate--cysteine ligase
VSAEETRAARERLIPDLGFSRLLLVATGGVAASDLPFWGTWLHMSYAGIETRVVLTRSARRFVTPDAVGGRFRSEVFDDTWPQDDPRARHVEFAEWAQACLVFPSTFNFTARLALGLADSPALLALQCTGAPVALAPALPPGGLGSAAFRQHLRALEERRNVVVVPPQPGTSLTTGRRDAHAPALLPDCLAELEKLRVALGQGSDRTPSVIPEEESA